MIRARYTGDVQNFSAFGIEFPEGEFVEVTNTKIAAKLKCNSHFEVKEGEFEDVQFTETKKTSKAKKTEER